MDTSASPEDLKKSRTEVADAESNTMHSGKCILLICHFESADLLNGDSNFRGIYRLCSS